MENNLTRLVEGARQTLVEGLTLLESVDDRSYSARPVTIETDSAGNHLRHCLEFFDCLLGGLASGKVDYASRKRDRAVARDRVLGMLRIAEMIDRLQSIERLSGDERILVRCEDDDDGGYCLLFNRDEKRTRGAARSPQIYRRDQVQFIAPIDADGGGTWILTNEYGVTVCLLNAYPNQGMRQTPASESRGKIPIYLAAARSIDQVDEQLSRMDLSSFAAFRLLAMEPNRPTWYSEWTGSKLTRENDADWRMPITSSSFEAAELEAARGAAFQDQIASRSPVTLNALELFHANHGPTASAHSVCMHRLNAQTVSFSRVTVSSNQV